MAAAGIITEYNPLHMGHVHLMAEARRLLGPETGILCVMSGNYVQRGDFAVAGKHARAAAAVRSGADLVLELPVPWALSSAEGFAAGAVEILKATGAVSHLVFGSEGGDAAPLVRCAEALCSGAFPEALREELKKGDSFPAARQRALLGLVPEGDALSRPNDTLGVEYCKALRGSGIQPVAVLRRGAAHDGADVGDGIASASAIRALLRQGEEEAALGLCAPAMAEAYPTGPSPPCPLFSWWIARQMPGYFFSYSSAMTAVSSFAEPSSTIKISTSSPPSRRDSMQCLI